MKSGMKLFLQSAMKSRWELIDSSVRGTNFIRKQIFHFWVFERFLIKYHVNIKLVNKVNASQQQKIHKLTVFSTVIRTLIC